MATIVETVQGTPTYPYFVTINFPINIGVSYTQPVGSPHIEGSASFIQQFDDYSLEMENAIKTHVDFSTQDEVINYSWEMLDFADNYGNVVVSFTIENAIVTANLQVNSELVNTELTAYLQEQADAYEYNYKANRNWYNL